MSLLDSEPDRETSDPFLRMLGALDDRERELLQSGLRGRGAEVRDPNRQLVGTVAAVLVDRETAKPQWLVIQVPGVANVTIAAPLESVEPRDPGFVIKLAAATVLSAPPIDPSFVTSSVERELCAHYGLPPTRGASQIDEQRATSSRAYQDTDNPDEIGWLPGPRQDQSARASAGQ